MSSRNTAINKQTIVIRRPTPLCTQNPILELTSNLFKPVNYKTDFLIGYSMHGKETKTTIENNSSITVEGTSVKVNKIFAFG